MSELEFEQKFVLDPNYAAEIQAEIRTRMFENITGEIIRIRQFYDKDDGRYRASYCGGDKPVCVRETKKSIKLGTKYSITQEEAKPITEDEFHEGWEKNKSRRLQKTRYIMPGNHAGHKVMVDFFYTAKDKEDKSVYAIIAETETMLTATTESLYLHFSLPIYLERYLLLTVDDSDPSMRVFKSANMVDTPESIEAVKKAIRKLYD